MTRLGAKPAGPARSALPPRRARPASEAQPSEPPRGRRSEEPSSTTARAARRREAGLTLVELMVSLVVVSIAVAFTFQIYTTSSTAYRSQTRVAELQQTLRAAKDQIVRDLRMAGHLAAGIVDGSIDPTFAQPPLMVRNNEDGTGPDSFQLVYADHSCESRVQRGNPFNAAVSVVDTWSCFVDGDVAIAVRTANPKRGQGCVMKITALVPGGPRLQHNPGASGAPYNQPGNAQCANISGPEWTDGHTVFLKYIKRAYRIRPNDPRGVLEMSTNGFAGPYTPLAYGFTDLQVALYVYEEGVGDVDGDGDPNRNWYSSENMEAPNFLSVNNRELLQARVSLVARTNAPVSGVMTEATPNLQGAPVANNMIGDHASIPLVDAAGQPVITDVNDKLYGNHVFRQISAVVDFRNMGIGK